jgi:hypothetical protein
MWQALVVAADILAGGMGDHLRDVFGAVVIRRLARPDMHT